jgi:hypothetical protein
MPARRVSGDWTGARCQPAEALQRVNASAGGYYMNFRFVDAPMRDTLRASNVSFIPEAEAMSKAIRVCNSVVIDGCVSANEACLQVSDHIDAALPAALLRLSGEPETCAPMAANIRHFVARDRSPAALAAALQGLAGRR